MRRWPGDTRTMVTLPSFNLLCCTTSVCAPNFGFHLDTATRCYCYNHFHSLLLQSQHLYCSKTEFMRNLLGQLPIAMCPPSIALSAWPYAICHETAPFHRYLTSLGSGADSYQPEASTPADGGRFTLEKQTNGLMADSHIWLFSNQTACGRCCRIHSMALK